MDGEDEQHRHHALVANDSSFMSIDDGTYCQHSGSYLSQFWASRSSVWATANPRKGSEARSSIHPCPGSDLGRHHGHAAGLEGVETRQQIRIHADGVMLCMTTPPPRVFRIRDGEDEE